MKILFLLASRAAGGAEILVRDLATELAHRGLEVGIVFISRQADLGGSPEFEARYQETLEANSVETFDLGHECRRNPVLGARRLLTVIDRFRPDVLHVHLQYGLLFRLLLWPRRIATVYTHHTDRFRQGRRLFRLLSLTVDRFVAISRQTEKLLRPVVGDRVSRIFNAVRFPGRSGATPGRAADCVQIISVGRLYPPKDYPTLVRTVARLLEIRPDLRAQVRFLVVGKGPGGEQLTEQIAAAGLESTITLLGTRTDVDRLMVESDLFLMTSIAEGLPITLIEALHAGLPIVATDVGGCSEIVEHGVNGFLAPPGDASALARHLEQLIDNAPLRAAFAAASLEKATQFSIANCAADHIALYRRVSEGSARP